MINNIYNNTILRNNTNNKFIKTIIRYISSDDIQKYKTDTNTLAKWLDISIVKYKGRAFDACLSLVNKKNADIFNPIKVIGLNGKEMIIPNSELDDDNNTKAKLVVFSFKNYGFSLVRSWINPFLNRFIICKHIDNLNTDLSVSHNALNNNNTNNRNVIAYEICFVEYGFLSLLKSLFISNIKGSIHQSQVNYTGLKFGGTKDFAASLLLPNAYTGYAYLLDNKNRIRWKASGQALEHEVEALMKCTEELLLEN